MGIIVKTFGLKNFQLLKRFSLTTGTYTGETKNNDIATQGYIPPFYSQDCATTYTRLGQQVFFSSTPPYPPGSEFSGGVHSEQFNNIFS